MNNDFLKRLYWACSSGVEPFSEDGCNLSRLYKPSPGVVNAMERFCKALYSSGLEKTETSKLESLNGEGLIAAEECGFINGFRLGMMLAGELHVEEEE